MTSVVQATQQATALLAGFTAAATLVLAVAYQVAAPQIAENERVAQLALLNGIAAVAYTNDPLAERRVVNDDASGVVAIFPLRQAGAWGGAIAETVAADGYNGAIRLLVGVNAAREVVGVRVVAHRETPGFSDELDLRRADWLHQFDGKSLGNPTAARWKVRKDQGDFDQFTGATITPRAVVKAVANTLKYLEKHHDELTGAVTP